MDVLAPNAACNFVADFEKYVNCIKYNTDCSYECSLQSFAALKQLQSDCEEADLREAYCVVGNSPSQICTTPGVTQNCVDSVTLDLEVNPSTCSTGLSLKNPVNGSMFTRLVPQDDTVYHVGTMNLNLTDSCGTNSTTTVSSGCTSGGCSLDNNAYVNTFAWLPNIKTGNPAGYIREITLYATDVTGQGPLVAYNVNVAPSNVSAWNSCVGCVAITTSNLLFGASTTNFRTELAKLLNNVSRTLFGAASSDWSVAASPTDVQINSKIKHNPSGYWSGINVEACTIKWVNQAGVITTVNFSPRSTFLNVGSTTSAQQFYQSYNLSTSCGTRTGVVDIPNIKYNVNQGASNINFLKLSTGDSNTSVTQTFSNTSCTAKNLSGTATVTSGAGTIATRAWLDPSLTQVSSTTTYTTTGSGTYTFRVTTSNGCVEQDTITI